MRVQDASEEKKAWTTKNDPRVTPIGKFMRKTNIDELPQLVNVLRGDMSLVGPRPERPFFVKKFQEVIPRYMIKHQVRPGMTGWAQINGRDLLNIPDKVKLDGEYIKRISFFFDLRCCIITFFSVLTRRGVSDIKTEQMHYSCADQVNIKSDDKQ